MGSPDLLPKVAMLGEGIFQGSLGAVAAGKIIILTDYDRPLSKPHYLTIDSHRNIQLTKKSLGLAF